MNMIKTKIGFDTKPYTIPALKLYELIQDSTRLYGQVLLLLSVMLSAGSCAYLRSIHADKVQKLLLLKQEAKKLEKRYNHLIEEHDVLSSARRLHTISTEIGLSSPTAEEVICLPK